MWLNYTTYAEGGVGGSIPPFLPKHFNIMKLEKTYKQIEQIVRQEKIMEKYYNIPLIPIDERTFTTSQETDIKEMILDGLDIPQIINKIKKW
jgi:hypothetical protein